MTGFKVKVGIRVCVSVGVCAHITYIYIYERDPSRVYLTPYFFYSKGKII